MHTLKGALVAVSADNLASQVIGGYEALHQHQHFGNAGNVWLLVTPCKPRLDLKKYL